jgi:hypothetical protein
MAQQAPSRSKIPTVSPQPARGRAAKQAKVSRQAPDRMLANGSGRAATRGGGEVIELEHGITVYPAREEQGRWRAVWHENGQQSLGNDALESDLYILRDQLTARPETVNPRR